jgi:hypothetical protein
MRARTHAHARTHAPAPRGRYDGATQRRRSVAANAATGALAGLHREECLARLAARDLALPLLDLDLLAGLAHELTQPARTRLSQYVRVAAGPEHARRGRLAHVVKVKYFDALGRVTRVRPGPWSARAAGPYLCVCACTYTCARACVRACVRAGMVVGFCGPAT